MPAHGLVWRRIVCRRMAMCADSWPCVPARGRVCRGMAVCAARGRVCQRMAVCRRHRRLGSSRSSWTTARASALFLHSPAAVQRPAVRIAMHALAVCSDVHLVRHSCSDVHLVRHLCSDVHLVRHFSFMPRRACSVCAGPSLVAVANLLLHSFMPNQMRVAIESSIEQPAA